MDSFITLHALRVRAHDEPVFNNQFDEKGEPIIKYVFEKFAPGSFYTPADSAERDWLLGLEAIRPLSEHEITLHEKLGQTTGFPVKQC